MAPEALVHATKAWLQSSWHVQVPFAWLEACVDWLQEEAGGTGALSQQQINQQALDQWLLTDLRDLDFPVLPEGLAQAQKTELRGFFCVQVDSLLNISQPAYGQLQKWRGTDCTNDEVSATTQATQKPWEAKSTRMLLLQVTDGVQSLEAMEYQPIPALSTDLRPGVKLQLQGQIVCRLGMLLLGPTNVKVLGGEVEDLTDRNNQGRVLCRTLGLPEDQQQDRQEAAPSLPVNQEDEGLEINDQELLTGLEAQEQAERVPFLPVRDSGYETLSETSTRSSRNSSDRSLISNASARSEISIHPSRSGLTQSSRGHHHSNQRQESRLLDTFSSDHMIEQEIADDYMADADFPEEDFDDLPLDELDSVILQESTDDPAAADGGEGSTLQNNQRTGGHPDSLHRTPKLYCGQVEQHRDSSGSTDQLSASSFQPRFPSAPPERSHQSSHSLAYDESDFMDEDMDCYFLEEDPHGTLKTGQTHQPTVQTSRQKDNNSGTFSPSARDFDKLPAKTEQQGDITPPALTLTTPPFIYLSLLEKMMPKPHGERTVEIRVKAFIVTLIGKLSSTNGSWRVCATVSDGSGYLDVELSDAVLTSLLGFSVAEKAALRRDPARRKELDAGMRRCQEELVDMCCVMTIAIEPESRKSVVTKADPVSEIIHQELEQRVRDRRK